jgi:MFS family permease
MPITMRASLPYYYLLVLISIERAQCLQQLNGAADTTATMAFLTYRSSSPPPAIVHSQRTTTIRATRMMNKLFDSHTGDETRRLFLKKDADLEGTLPPTQLNAQVADDVDIVHSPPTPPPSSSFSEILLLVFPLLFIYISNQWSRYSISYLVDFSNPTITTTTSTTEVTKEAAISAFKAMNIDCQFTQSQYGLLASTAFTILFAFSSLIAGTLADRYDRKLLTILPAIIWTMATFWTSQAHTYNEVLMARIVMGGACAFAVPAAYTLIADRVSKDKLALSNSIYGSGVYLGGALASLCLLLDESVGWRGTLRVIGGFGAVSAAAAGLLLPSDGSRGDKPTEGEVSSSIAPEEEIGIVPTALGILSIPRVRFLFIASFFRFCSGLMIGVWAAPYYKQAFPDNAAEYAVINALIVGGLGMSSGILGGYIADGLGTWIKETKNEELSSSSTSIIHANFDEQTIRLLLPIIGSILAIPAWYLTTHTTTTTTATNAFEITMAWLAIEYLVAECWFGPTITVLQSTVGASRRGTAQGMFVLTGALGNLAPSVLGLIYGNQLSLGSSPDPSSSSEVLANLLAWGVCSGYALSSLFFIASVRSSGVSVEFDTKEQ